MITGIYESASGLDSLSKWQEVVANNLANVSTYGFKQEMLRIAQGQDGNLAITRQVDFKNGPLEMTNQPLDVALKQDGYFVVSTPSGPAYTRNGNFSLDTEGKVVNGSGYAVQGEKGDIVLGNRPFTLSGNGEFLVDNEVVDRLQVVKPPEDLKPMGNTLFTSENKDQAEPLAAEDVTVLPGALERSNVALTQTMVDMLAVVRLYEANQKALQSEDEALKLAVSQVGRIA